ncbi:MAG: class I SAM-dependent methyltransferase [Actinobacteria bacterium]|nr:class I SAM-dependent methyltransferase [Actinomycetota bacterium]
MPIQIDRARARDLAPQLDDALQIVSNEFDGLDAHRGYHNAFARALKPDPLGRVLMLGTDQRDLFVPLLRRTVAEQVPAGGQIFDIGAGDGQTFGYIADAVPAGTMVSIAEPNPAYLAAYQGFLERQPHLRGGAAVLAGLDALDEEATGGVGDFPEPGSVDVALGLHMIYFATDVARSLRAILRFLKPGGVYVNVVTDETTAFNGAVLRSFVESGGDTGNNDRCFAAMDERRHLLAPESEGGGELARAAAAAGIEVEVDAIRQASRMYGNSLIDLLALANISMLNGQAGTRKFESAAKVLRDRPEEVDLRIETEGPRTGMWSVVQPQWVTRVRRAG